MANGDSVTLHGKLIIGLTGNIATGKSAVMRLAAERGALTIDADRVVHEIMDEDVEMQAALAVAFGAEVRREDGRIDRAALGEIVFNDPQALQDLEAMIHPAVRRRVVKRIQESEATVVFIEAIKLLEGGLAQACHQVWVTRCTRQRQQERLQICRGLPPDEANTRIDAQPPQEEKVALADVVIDTNGYMRDTAAQFQMAWQRLPDAGQAAPKQIVLPPKQTLVLGEESEVEAPTPAEPDVKTAVDIPDDVRVRRAKPSDIPSILLLIRKATGGVKELKRSDLLLALSERGYFIGQQGTQISTVMGWLIDSQVGRIDEIYVDPLEMAPVTGTAVLAEIEKSAFNHLCEAIVVFLPPNVATTLRQIFVDAGFQALEKEKLARNWQLAIEETQPENTTFLLKIYRDTRAT